MLVVKGRLVAQHGSPFCPGNAHPGFCFLFLSLFGLFFHTVVTFVPLLHGDSVWAEKCLFLFRSCNGLNTSIVPWIMPLWGKIKPGSSMNSRVGACFIGIQRKSFIFFLHNDESSLIKCKINQLLMKEIKIIVKIVISPNCWIIVWDNQCACVSLSTYLSLILGTIVVANCFFVESDSEIGLGLGHGIGIGQMSYSLVFIACRSLCSYCKPSETVENCLRHLKTEQCAANYKKSKLKLK